MKNATILTFVEDQTARYAGSTLPELPMALPPVREQDEVVGAVHFAVRAGVDQDAPIGLSLGRSAAQRQCILRAAFSGQVVPQDPNDQPTSMLLNRLRARRAAAGEGPVRRPSKPRAAAQAPA
ncbi:restriction endonuclease subunit S [Xenophilus aerolatus]|nr:restriction endonuclease subunit S [Xenophilus aerolatus]